MITMAPAMISAVTMATAATPPTMMAMELFVLVLGLGGSVVMVMELGPTCTAEKMNSATVKVMVWQSASRF